MRRGFLAIEPPPPVLDEISGCAAHLRDEGRATHHGLRWTTRGQWHVTLQFLGRVGDVDALVETVHGAASGIPAFDVRLGGAGAFPRPARASILWLGVERGRDALSGLASAVTGATATLGYEADVDFRPHLTLARAKQRRDLRWVVEAIGDRSVGPRWTVCELVLFDSDTRPEGARYTAVRRIPLGE